MASLAPRLSDSDLDAFVLQHLQQRGFTGAASTLCSEMAQKGTGDDTLTAEASRPALVKLLVSTARLKELYDTMRDWVEASLEAYRPELRAVLFPFFVHCYLRLVQGADLAQAAALLRYGREDHALFHRTELNLLSQVIAPSHIDTHEFAARVRSRRFEVSLSAQSRELLLHFLQQASFTPLLQLLNEHITLRVERVAPPVDGAAADGSGQAGDSDEARPSVSDSVAAASAAAQMWVGVGAEGVRTVNSEVVQWGPPKAVHDKHEQISTELGIPNPNASLYSAQAAGDDDDAAGGGARGGRGKDKGGGKKRGRGGGRGAKDGGKEGGAKEAANVTALVDKPRLPLPPLADKVEKEFLRDARKRLALDGATPPSAAMVTWVDSAGAVCCAAFSHDGAIVACGFADGTLRLAMLKEAPQGVGKHKKKKAAATAAEGAAAPAAADAPASAGADAPAGNGDGAAAAAASTGSDWDTLVNVSMDSEEPSAIADAETSARMLTVLRGHSGPVYGASFSRDDNYVISCSQDGTARLWGVLQRACLVCYRAHPSPVWSVRFAPIGPYFATCGYDRSVRVWRVDSTQPIRMLCGHLSDVRCCAFHPNPSLIASGSEDASIRVWDVKDAKCVRLLCHHGHASAVSCLDISPDGTLLASGGDDRMLLVWHLPSARLCRRIAAHTTPLWSVAFSQDGAQLATSSSDCTLAVWDARAAAAAADGDTTTGGAAATPSHAAADRHLIVRLYTKFTPVVRAHYTRTNVLLATGSFSPPADYRPPPSAGAEDAS